MMSVVLLAAAVGGDPPPASSELDLRVRGTALEVESPRASLTLRTGMVPLPSLSALNTGFRRAAGPSGVEAAGLLGGNALGSTLTFALPARFGEVSGGVYEPGGLVGNQSPRVGARMWLSPFDALLPHGASSPFRFLASTEQASFSGIRHVVAATFQNRLGSFGADRSYARGAADDPLLETRAAGAFFTLNPMRRVDAFVRYDVVERLERARLVTAGLAFRAPPLPRLTHGMDLLAAFQHVEGRPVTVGAIDALTTQRTVRVDLSIRF